MSTAINHPHYRAILLDLQYAMELRNEAEINNNFCEWLDKERDVEELEKALAFIEKLGYAECECEDPYHNYFGSSCRYCVNKGAYTRYCENNYIEPIYKLNDEDESE